MFEFRTRTPIDVVAQRLRALHKPAQSIFQSWCKNVNFTPQKDGGYDFEICAQEHKWSGDHAVVQAIGTLKTDSSTHETVTTGLWKPTYRDYVINTIKGMVVYLVAIAVLVLIFVEDVEQRSRTLLGFVVIAALVCAWLLYEYWRNRRGLARALEAATQHPAGSDDT